MPLMVKIINFAICLCYDSIVQVMESKLKGKKVLVTGGVGFVGSNLASSLLGSGNTVVCLDNFSTGKLANVRQFEGNGSFQLLEGDIRSCEDCSRATEVAEIVFHQAALGPAPRSLKDPVTTTDVNIGGFVRVLEASKQSGVARSLYRAYDPAQVGHIHNIFKSLFVNHLSKSNVTDGAIEWKK